MPLRMPCAFLLVAVAASGCNILKVDLVETCSVDTWSLGTFNVWQEVNCSSEQRRADQNKDPLSKRIKHEVKSGKRSR